MTDDALDEFTAALQDVVLPAGVPVLPALDLAAHFWVPADPGESTGAFFDVVPLPSGRVALTMGQVPDRGLAAVAAASAVLAVLRAGLLELEDPAAALRLANRYAEHSPDATGTTAVVALLDPVSGELTWATAGHPPPLVVGVDGVTELEQTSTETLGRAAAVTVGQRTLAERDLVLMSSERATPDDAAAAGTGTASERCEALATELAGRQARGAVIVIAAAPRAAGDVTPDLDLELELDSGTNRLARQELEGWLTARGASQIDSLMLTHAAAELVTNVVEHAYAPDAPSRTARLAASQSSDGTVLVDVSDRGRWRGASQGGVGRGRGLAMAAGLVDDFAVTTGEDGTQARLRHRLTRPVRINRMPLREGWPEAKPLEVTQTAPGALHVSGEFGHDEVDQVTQALLLASQGRTQPLEIDLSEVTTISAGGMRMLDDLVRRGEGDSVGRAAVVLLARTGSASQVELERARIAHRAS